MSELLKRIAIDGAIITVALTALIFVLKLYATKFISFKIDEKLAQKKIELELKKEKELAKLTEITKLYPKVLELTYRLRNLTRKSVSFINQEDFFDLESPKKSAIKKVKSHLKVVRENIHTLEELVITSKTYLDIDTHNKFHDFKNQIIPIYKDISNLLSNYEKKSINAEQLTEFLIDINNKYENIDTQFSKITGNVKTKLNTSN